MFWYNVFKGDNMELNEIKGIGSKTLQALNKLNIFTVDDLVNYYPYRYQKYTVKKLEEIENNENCVLCGKIESEPQIFYFKKNFNRLTFKVLVENILLNVAIFNRAFLKKNLMIGKEITLIGKYEKLKNHFVASDIKLEKINQNEIEPIYHGNKDIKSKNLGHLINTCLQLNFDYEDDIPKYLIEKYSFVEKKEALKEIHQPKNIANLKACKIRLIYEELFVFMFKIMYLKFRNEKENEGLKRNISYQSVEDIISTLPFLLTEDQKKAIMECLNDLNSHKRMNRLILGDVGSGKTIVAILAMIINTLSGYQSALMAPTEILAKQHYKTILDLTKDYDFHCELLIGSMTKKEKDTIKKKLALGEIDIIVGTHALITNDVIFKNLGLVVTDEQHRFGVNQRTNLQNKGKLPDIIYLSATPIPRTYALTIYGDMDTSLIKEKPSGRKEIITKIKKTKELKDVLYHMLEEIKLGHQVYVVSSLIESDDEQDLKDIMLLKEKLDVAFHNKVTIGILHGKLKNNEKEAIINDFRNNVIKILLCTTIIEVGVDIQNATMMVIFDADRFGLATLHQLRGRVGRNDYQSYCYLICDKEKERLQVLEESNDGFVISQKDFELRGEGDLFGIKQSGDMQFKIADLKRDYKILYQAKEDVIEFIKTKEFLNNIFYKRIVNSIDFLN